METETMNPKTLNDISMSEPALADLEQDIKALLTGGEAERKVRHLITEVVTGSDFVPEDEQAAVALEMYTRYLTSTGWA